MEHWLSLGSEAKLVIVICATSAILVCVILAKVMNAIEKDDYEIVYEDVETEE